MSVVLVTIARWELSLLFHAHLKLKVLWLERENQQTAEVANQVIFVSMVREMLLSARLVITAHQKLMTKFIKVRNTHVRLVLTIHGQRRFINTIVLIVIWDTIVIQRESQILQAWIVQRVIIAQKEQLIHSLAQQAPINHQLGLSKKIHAKAALLENIVPRDHLIQLIAMKASTVHLELQLKLLVQEGSIAMKTPVTKKKNAQLITTVLEAPRIQFHAMTNTLAQAALKHKFSVKMVSSLIRDHLLTEVLIYVKNAQLEHTQFQIRLDACHAQPVTSATVAQTQIDLTLSTIIVVSFVQRVLIAQKAPMTQFFVNQELTTPILVLVTKKAVNFAKLVLQTLITDKKVVLHAVNLPIV